MKTPYSSGIAVALHRHPGFTLIELLTVIAIIGILAAIIIPTVGVVRGKARAAQCASNLRQIGLAMNLYADENKDTFPKANTDDPDNPIPWMLKLAPYVGISDQQMGSAPKFRATGVFNCPDFVCSNVSGDPDFRKVAYAYQDNISGSVYSRWKYLRSAPPAPSQYFLLTEIAENMDTFKPGTYPIAFRHPGKSANFLFADGHVASLRDPVPADDPRWRW
ncbi:MAG: DUF1559 domain-containing protein [Opitutaceae bacterium]|jgi:prepilin-type N-terminal cleavage/methylation domain-containing protein/prepilin-type processing-associated H-X9-DG protein|nr:DUF1559 domain-containing protein [Opitutaceae bacterium]